MRCTAFSAAAAILLLISCSGGRPGKNDAPGSATTGQSLTRTAWEMRRDGAPTDSIIAVQRQAVEEMRRGESADDPVEVLEQMGYLHNIHGDYAEALRYYREATDSLKTQPGERRNDGAIQLFGDISSLYAYLGMTEQALEMSDSALAESRRQGGVMLSDVWRFRAGIYELDDAPEEAMRCYDMALDAVEHGQTRTHKEQLRKLILGERAHLMINAWGDRRDSVDKAVEILEEVMTDYEFDNADRVYALGLGYVKQGKARQGIPLLQEAAESYRRQEDIERINVANTALLEVYAEEGMCGELAALVPQYIADSERLLEQTQSAAVIGAMVQYDIDSTKDRNRVLQLQLEVAREKRMMRVGLAVGVIFALLYCSFFLYKRLSRMTHASIRQENELKGLNKENSDLNQRNSALHETNSALNEVNSALNERNSALHEKNSALNEENSALNERVEMLEKDISAGINSNHSVLSTPQLLTGNGEGRFRRAFNVLYPTFLPRLKEDYPKMTPNDELLCMLLYLKHTTEEMSIYLGISHASVNSARYRLRIKFGLPKDVELDAFIASRKS